MPYAGSERNLCSDGSGKQRVLSPHSFVRKDVQCPNLATKISRHPKAAAIWIHSLGQLKNFWVHRSFHEIMTRRFLSAHSFPLNLIKQICFSGSGWLSPISSLAFTRYSVGVHCLHKDSLAEMANPSIYKVPRNKRSPSFMPDQAFISGSSVLGLSGVSTGRNPMSFRLTSARTFSRPTPYRVLPRQTCS